MREKRKCADSYGNRSLFLELAGLEGGLSGDEENEGGLSGHPRV